MLGINLALFYPGGFLYSTAVVPVLAVIFGRYLDLRQTPDRWLVAAATIAILVNNAVQIDRFRSILAGM